MYGKTYESMYSGSMVGAGLNVFAVWNYIITKTHFGVIELNPKLLNAILGGTVEEIVAAIEFLGAPDPESRSKAEDGRRIVKEGQFQYRVVNWEEYQAIRNADELREYNRRKQAEYRAKISAMTPEELASYRAGRSKGYAKRRKPVGVRAAGNNGEMDGAQEAIVEGMAERMPVMGNPTSQVPRGTSPESGEVGKKAPSAGIPAEITPEAAAKMRAYVEEQARLTKAREAAQQRPAATVARPMPAVAIVGPVGMPKPIGSPMVVGWAEQEVEIGKAAPGVAPARVPAKPAGPVPISAAIHHPVKAAGQG